MACKARGRQIEKEETKVADYPLIKFLENYGKNEDSAGKTLMKKFAPAMLALYLAIAGPGCNPELQEPPQPTYVKIISSGDTVETLSRGA